MVQDITFHGVTVPLFPWGTPMGGGRWLGCLYIEWDPVEFLFCLCPCYPDKIQHLQDSDHIAVYHAGRLFRVSLYYKGKLLEPCEFQAQFEAILCDPTPPLPGEEKLPSMTAGERWEADLSLIQPFSKLDLWQLTDGLIHAMFLFIQWTWRE